MAVAREASLKFLAHSSEEKYLPTRRLLLLPGDGVGPPWSRFELCCEEVIDPLTIDSHDPVAEITRRYTAALERMVRRALEQYFWVHRRWKSQPEQRRAPRSLRKAG